MSVDDDWRSTEDGDNHIHNTVVVQIPKRCSPPCDSGQRVELVPRKLPLPVAIQSRRLEIMETRVDLLDVVQNMALSGKHVLPSIVVEILQPDSPTGTAGHHSGETRRGACP